jgi:hypothetical protein
MHPGRRAAFQELAHARIVQAAETLAERFGLEQAEIPTTVNQRHPEVAALEQQQAVADLLEQLVEKTAPAQAAAEAEPRPAARSRR